MKRAINLTKGLYFKNESELERAMLILMENGFEPNESMETYSDVEIALSVENQRLARRYNTSAFVAW